MSESNRRKEMRAAGQGSMQEQPKVVDQMVAEMAPQQMPEDQGIGQLPAGEMNFAGGGIIAFADGGDVERYQFGGMPPRSLMGDIPGFVAGTGNFIPQQGAPEEVPLFRRMFREARAKGADYQVEQAKARIAAGVGTSADQAILAAAQSTQGAAPSPQDMAQFDAASNLYMTERAAKQAAVAPKVDAAPKADTKPTAPRPAPTDKAAPTTDTTTQDKGVSGLDALVKDFTRSTELAQGALRNQRVGLASQLEQEALGTKEEGEKRRKERGDVFASRETRLAAREGELTGMKDKHFGLALLQAGAAMMTTPGNLGMALGKGVQVGSERYIAGIDKINAAKDKFAEARDRLDDLRLNRDDMNEKEVRDENRAIRNARIQGQQLFVDGATKDLEISNANQKAIFGVAAENIIADKRIKSAENISANELKTRERIAQIPQGQERLATLLGGGDLAKGLAKFTEIQAGKFNPTTAYTEYLSKRKEGDTVLTPQQFVTQIKSIQALMGNTPPAPVDTTKPNRP
jgi:hypothetical protein